MDKMDVFAMVFNLFIWIIIPVAIGVVIYIVSAKILFGVISTIIAFALILKFFHWIMN